MRVLSPSALGQNHRLQWLPLPVLLNRSLMGTCPLEPNDRREALPERSGQGFCGCRPCEERKREQWRQSQISVEQHKNSSYSPAWIRSSLPYSKTHERLPLVQAGTFFLTC